MRHGCMCVNEVMKVLKEMKKKKIEMEGQRKEYFVVYCFVAIL